LCITFDRISSASTIIDHLPTGKMVTNASYKISMRILCQIGLNIVRQRATTRKGLEHVLQIAEFLSKIEEVVGHATEHLTDLTKCKSMKDQLELWNFYLHRSYITAELCRPAIFYHRKQKFQQHQEMTKSLSMTCIENLKNTVEAFLGLRNITKFATQSWAAVHRSLSCAVLLGILGEPMRHENTRQLLLQVVSVMQESYLGVEPSEMATPVSRAIAALQKLTPEEPIIVDVSTTNILFFENPEEIMMISGGSNSSTSSTSPATYFADQEQYPYSLLNSILWGNSDALPI
jgi:hypothetical protein